uniref:Uncharacterized protein n=1 Tax=Cucumis sativus TaxID=3659 RepID=A0A0A0LDK5_CUCSA
MGCRVHVPTRSYVTLQCTPTKLIRLCDPILFFLLLFLVTLSFYQRDSSRFSSFLFPVSTTNFDERVAISFNFFLFPFLGFMILLRKITRVEFHSG